MFPIVVMKALIHNFYLLLLMSLCFLSLHSLVLLFIAQAIKQFLISSSHSYSGLHSRGILLIYEAISRILMLILSSFPILNVKCLFSQLK